MDIKMIHGMLEKLTECAKHEVDAGIDKLDAGEFGKVVDMIKNLSEAEYYRTITVAMHESDAEYGEDYDYMGPYDSERRHYNHNRYANGKFAPRGKGVKMQRRGYDEMPYYHMTPEMYREHESDPEYWRDMDRQKMGRMYYTDTGMGGNMSHSSGNSYGNSGSRDHREGKSGMSRRNYMETKEMHKSNTPEDKTAKMKSIEEYVRDLGDDISEMISNASNEEKTILKQKLTLLTQKL